VDAGFQWRFPYPFQAHETVSVTQLRSVEIGRNSVPGHRPARLVDADAGREHRRHPLHGAVPAEATPGPTCSRTAQPDEAVVQASESAVREIVGRSKVDSVLYEQRDAIAADLVKSVQAQLDRLKAGILIVNVNVQNVQVPEQVQAAFNDAFKAGADRDRFKNEGQAYASDVIPKARGTASRLKEEAEGYRARVIAQAEGDAQRFRSVLAEYQKAPAVTRDRLYIETMQQVYSNVSKVMVDSRSRLEPAVPAAGQADAAVKPCRPPPPATGAGAALSPPVPPARRRMPARATARARDREGR
jgi:membrane protease subunit HflK